MNPEPGRARMQDILKGDRCIRPVSVFDAASARIAESIGFEAGMYAGSVASLVVLSAPDIILLTLSEFAAQARRICRGSELPIICDADHGYGNALNVMRTVEELDAAGVAALTIEDTDLPRPFGAAKPRPLPLAEGLGKMRAAVAARRANGPSIIARTGSITMTGLDDTLERVRAYQDTGVDGLFLAGLTKKADLEAVARIATVPLALSPPGPELDDTDLLASHGVRFALMGHQPIMAALEAVRQTMQAQRDGTGLPALAAKELMETVTRASEHTRQTNDYLEG